MQITADQLESLALGAALLGSGGGGDPCYSLQIVERQINKYGPVNIIPVSDLEEDDLVIPLALMGAPLVSLERIIGEKEFVALLNKIEETYQKKANALAIVEIGGSNAFTPFIIAGKLGLPVVDADMIGRAFPELQMISTTVHDLKPQSTFLSDIFGNTVIINCSDFNRIEKYARQITITFGSSAAIVLRILTGKEAKEVMIKNTLSLALEMGRIITSSQQQQNPMNALISSNKRGKYIGTGIITDIDQKIDSGFLQGTVTIRNSEECSWVIKYQNEYLYVFKGEEIVAVTPDIIAILDAENGTPLTSESLNYGLRVNIISMASPDIWYTEKGLKIVGPNVFKSMA